MTIWTVLGIALVLGAMMWAGLYSGRRVKNAGDFLTGGGSTGALLVCGSIMGSLVSSQATIGTVQLAFQYGVSAWWFTIGAGLGCLILALGYVSPLRRSGCVTEMQIISREYGPLTERLGSVLCCLGIFLSILAQVIACAGLLLAIFPGLSFSWGAALSALAMGGYVILGGAWSAGIGGVIKLVLLYTASMAGMAYALAVSGGLSGLLEDLSRALCGTDVGMLQSSVGLSDLPDSAALSQRFLAPLARGAVKDLGSCLSLLLGVLSTQTYAQAVWSAKSDRAARRGALLSACLIPPLGGAGICVGLFMRAHYITQGEAAALAAAGLGLPSNASVLQGTIQAFPVFALDHLPPLFAGIVLGTLFITVMGGGAGLSLGMSAVVVKDIWKQFSKQADTPRAELRATRASIALILLLATGTAIFLAGTTINDLGFLSMGLRGCVVFLPMSCALWLKGRVRRSCVLASILLGPLTVLAGMLLKLSADPLLLGMAVSLVLCLLGAVLGRKPSEGSRPGV